MNRLMFNSHMVVAWAEGRKRETRRIITPGTAKLDGTSRVQLGEFYIAEALRPCAFQGCVAYSADGVPANDKDKWLKWPWKVKSLAARYMPVRFARYHGVITTTRAERVQDITDEGAIAEGARQTAEGWTMLAEGIEDAVSRRMKYKTWESPRLAFVEFWLALHGVASWALNDRVWVHTLAKERT